MYCYWKTIKNSGGIRYPKWFEYGRKTFVIGSVKHSSVIYENNNITKYGVKVFKIEEAMKMIHHYTDIDTDTFKSIIFNDFVSFEHKDVQIMSSESETQLLLTIRINNGSPFYPTFDDCVNYANDHEHIMCGLTFDSTLKLYTIMFRIKNDGRKLYSAQTQNFVSFTNTQEIELFGGPFIAPSTASYFYFSETNDDDDGLANEYIGLVERNTIHLFKKSLELHAAIICQRPEASADLLNFGIHGVRDRYIYYNELQEKHGTRYIEMSESENGKTNGFVYTTHGPSCGKLEHVLRRCHIDPQKDSILDIGCGRGYALAILSQQPFKHVAGIEISEEDVKWCCHNIHEVLGQHHVEIIHDDVLNFDEYASYNYFYLYNPFGADIFSRILSHMRVGSRVIYKNMHEQDREVLESNGFQHIMTEKGVERDYLVWEKHRGHNT